jgi:hypothetical protein
MKSYSCGGCIIAFNTTIGYNNIRIRPSALLKRFVRPVVAKRSSSGMSTQEIKAKIQAAAPHGRIPCAAAFKLAEELGLTRSRLGELCNELNIKIIQCQLGCFP